MSGNASQKSSPELAQVVRMVKWLLYVSFAVLFYIVLKRIAPILTPVVAALAVAYLLDGWVDTLVARGIKRVWAVTLLLVGFLSITGLLIVLAIPLISTELFAFVTHLPGRLEEFSLWLSSRAGIEVPAAWHMYLQGGHLEELVREAAGPSANLTHIAVGGFVSIMGILAELLLIPVFAFYFLLDWDHILRRTRLLIPPRYRELTTGIVVEIDMAVSTWIRGQLIVTTLLGILYAVTFKVIGIEYGITIGFLVGVLTIIPFLGTLVGVVITMGVLLMGEASTAQMISVGATFVILHLLEAAVLTPKLVGKKVGLGEVGALFAVLAGGQLFGFTGVLLAVPIAASLAVLIRRVLGYYETTNFFRQGEEMVAGDAAVEDPVS